MLIGIPCIIGGVYLRSFTEWSRGLVIVTSALNILNCRSGAILGCYGLWVLLTPETDPLFSAPPPDSDPRSRPKPSHPTASTRGEAQKATASNESFRRPGAKIGLHRLVWLALAAGSVPAASADEPPKARSRHRDRRLRPTASRGGRPSGAFDRRPRYSRCVSNTFADLLKLDSSLDLRQRAPNSIQGDLSIRGGGFGQTLILLDGLRLNDVQSGHHNLDVPGPARSDLRVSRS